MEFVNAFVAAIMVSCVSYVSGTIVGARFVDTIIPFAKHPDFEQKFWRMLRWWYLLGTIGLLAAFLRLGVSPAVVMAALLALWLLWLTHACLCLRRTIPNHPRWWEFVFSVITVGVVTSLIAVDAVRKLQEILQ